MIFIIKKLSRFTNIFYHLFFFGDSFRTTKIDETQENLLMTRVTTSTKTFTRTVTKIDYFVRCLIHT